MDQMIGKKLDGRYELLELIGCGGMANVYKAKDLTENRIVAVKILKEEFLQNEEILKRFKNESRAISMLDHPNIVKVYDVSVWDKTQFIVMELVDGINLQEYMDGQGGKLSWKDTVHFTEETLEALRHAHSKGIIHRDIKPQNIMMLPDGSIRVMDFGIARFSRSGVQTSTDKAMGSVHYISPEQAKGEPTDARSDLYSVGVMMYQMLTGKLPFDGDSNVAVAIKQISEKAVDPRKLNPDIPDGLAEIVGRAMQKDPARRYQSAGDMLADIAAFKQDPSIGFEYKYLHTDNPTRYIDTVAVKKNEKQTKSKKKLTFREAISHYTVPVMLGITVAFMLCCALLVYLIFKFSGNSLFAEKQDVELLDFVGMDYQTVASEYGKMFNFEVVENYRSDYQAGYIYDQSPKAPKQVKEGHTVTLRVSKGVRTVTVPDLVGYTRDDAKKTLTALDLSVMFMNKVDSTAAVGTIISTDPAAGTQMTSGQKITVYISAEKVDNERQVPNLLGLTVDDAKKVLSERSLSIGTVTEVEDGAPAGTVVAQAVEEGTTVYTGSSINVSVSLGYVTSTYTVTYYYLDAQGNKVITGTETKTSTSGETNKEVETKHTWKAGVTVPPTCGQNGGTTYTCADCGLSYTVIIPATGNHTPGAWSTDGTTCTQKCTVCGNVTSTHAFVDANNDGNCDVCGAHNPNWTSSSSGASSGSSSSNP